MRVSVVHHFIKQFVDDHEVVSDRLFLEVLEVALEHFDEGDEEGENHDGVVVLFGDGDDVEIVVFVEVEEMVVLVLDDWSRWEEGYLRVYSSYYSIFLLKMS